MIRRSTWLTLGALALVIIAAVLLTRSRNDAQVTDPTPTLEPLWNVVGSEIVGLTIEDRASDSRIQLERHPEDLWRFVGSGNGSVDPARVERSVSWLASPRPKAQLLQGYELSDFALDPPQYVIEVALANGERRGFSVGRVSPTGGSRYVLASDIKGVLIFSNFGLDEVLSLPAELRAVATVEPDLPAE